MSETRQSQVDDDSCTGDPATLWRQAVGVPVLSAPSTGPAANADASGRVPPGRKARPPLGTYIFDDRDTGTPRKVVSIDRWALVRRGRGNGDDPSHSPAPHG